MTLCLFEALKRRIDIVHTLLSNNDLHAGPIGYA